MKPPYGVAGMNAVYGVPSPSGAWRNENISSFVPPYPMRLAWDLAVPAGRITMHRLVIPSLMGVLSAIYQDIRYKVKQTEGFELSTEHYDTRTQEELRKYGLDLYGGGFNYRLKRGGRTLSTHAWGCAIDIDPARNGLGDPTPAMPLFAVEYFEEAGWTWGGRWKRKDGMHFQYARGV